MQAHDADTLPHRPCLVFLSAAFTLSIALSLAIALTGGHESPFIALGYVSMLIPAVSVAIARAVIPDPDGIRGLKRFSWRYLPAALFLMPLVLHAVMLPLAISLSGLHLQPWLHPQPDGLFHTPVSRGWGVLTHASLAIHVAFNALVGLIVVSTLALFEEIGWRAWFQPRLSSHMSPRAAVVLTSAVWALWHVPFALSGILHAEGITPFTLALIAPIGIFGSGLILGWLWLRTESLWTAALAHGALNNWGQYAFKFADASVPNRDALLLAAGGLALITVGAILLAVGGFGPWSHGVSHPASKV